MTQRIKGILFDLGETIFDYGGANTLRMFKAGAELAYARLESLGQPLPSFNAFHRRQLRSVRWRYLLSRLSGREFNSLDLMTRIGKRMGHKLSRSQNMELAQLYYQPLAKCATVETGLIEMFRSFLRSGLTLGLVSNTFIPGEVLDEHLRQEGLLDMFSLRIYSSDVGWRKPNRRIFELALKSAGLRAGETLFVGDSLRADIRGANRVGMISVLKDPTDRYSDGRCGARHRIGKLTELVEIVAGYNEPTGTP